MILEVPLPKNVPAFVQQTQLDGQTYNLRVHWNEREGSFYLELGDVDGDPIVASRKLVPDWPLIFRVRDDRRPPGELLMVDLTGSGIPPQLDELGERVVLLYFDQAEMDANS